MNFIEWFTQVIATLIMMSFFVAIALPVLDYIDEEVRKCNLGYFFKWLTALIAIIIVTSFCSRPSFADQEALLQMWNSPTVNFNDRMVEQQQADSMRDLANSMRNIERIQRQQLQLQQQLKQQQYQDKKLSDVFKIRPWD